MCKRCLNPKVGKMVLWDMSSSSWSACFPSSVAIPCLNNLSVESCVQLRLGNNPSCTVKRSVTFRDLGRGREGWMDGAQGNLCAVKLFCVILWWWIHVTVCLSKPTECSTPSVNPNVNYGLWVTCQWMFNCNKYTTLVLGVDSEGGHSCVGTRGTLELSPQILL